MNTTTFFRRALGVSLSVAGLSLGAWLQAASSPGDLLVRVTTGDIATLASTSHGATWGDYDGDGNVDLYIANVEQNPFLFHNRGDGTLERVTAGDLPNSTPRSTSAAWADYDNDGQLDLLVTASGQSHLLWRGLGNGTFALNTTSGIETTGGETYASGWADYDNDGLVDLFVANAYVPSALYHNNGNGTFTRVYPAGLGTDAFVATGCAWGDYDNDGLPDLFLVIALGGPNALYHNLGNGAFQRVMAGDIVSDSGPFTCAAWADYDNDGYLDLAVARRGAGGNLLYHNNRNGTFTRMSSSAIMTETMYANGCAWADFDNDGFQDLVVANWEGYPNALFRNTGTGTFTRITTGSAGTDVAQCVTPAWTDYDNNGFPDLCVANLSGPNLLYRNQGNANNWLKVRLTGTASNRSAIGAKVRVKTTVAGTEQWQMREIRGGQGWGDSGLEALFGLGEATSVDTVRVEWPSGKVLEATTVAAQQTLALVEVPPMLLVSPKPGLFTNSVTVTLTSPLPDAEIRYTLDNTEPNPTATLYTKLLTLEDTTTVQARAYTNGVPASDLVTATYTKYVPPLVVVAPSQYATLPAERGSSLFAWTRRMQQVYGASHFPAKPIAITEIRLRPHATQGAGSAALNDLRVSLSTTAKQPDQLSTTFAENVGPDVTTVFQGALTVTTAGTGPAGGPKDFDLVIPLTTPFVFDPAKGNLLVDLRSTAPAGSLLEDSAESTSDQASRVYELANANATVATYSDTGANVLQFTYQANPPALWMYPAPGEFNNPIRVVLKPTVAGAEARYTLDGAEPQANAALYAAPLRLETTATVRARLFTNGAPASAEVSGTYVLPPKLDLQSVAVPAPYATTEDPLGGWDGLVNTVLRMQQIYGAAHFPDVPIWIHELRWRAKPGEKPGPATFPYLDIRLSTSPKAPGSLSSTFADNLGADEMIMLQGSLTVETAASGPPGGPNPFDMVARFRKPFLYDPSQGSLLVEFRNPQGAPGPLFSGSADPNDQAARAFAYSVEAATATAVDTGAEVLQFGYVEKPPPIWISPASGDYNHSLAVRLLTSYANGTIRYTLDGTEPTASSTAYAGSFKLSADTTVKARTFVDDAPVSDVLTAVYRITLTAPTIVTDPKTVALTEGNNYTLVAAVTGSPPIAYQWFLDGNALLNVTNATLSLTNLRLDQAGVYTLGASNEVSSTSKALLTLTVNPKPVAPTIVTQPESQMVVAGDTATFVVVATGTGPLTYTWRDRLQRVVGGNSPTLTLANVQKALEGNYTVRVQNAAGTKVSAPAMLTVVMAPVAPTIVLAPTDQMITAGDTAAFNVLVNGTMPLIYQWFWNGQAVAGATTSRLILKPVAREQEGTYTVTVANPVGSVATLGAVLTVLPLGPGGTVNFANSAPAAGIDAPVTDSDGVTRLMGAAYLAQLYGGPNAGELAPVGPAVPFRTATLSGYFVNGTRAIPTVPPGATAFVEVRVFESAAGPTYEAALTAGGKTGRSALLQIATGGSGTPAAPPADLVGLQPFSIARETVLPTVTLTGPVAGTTSDERFTLSGEVSDNISVGSARWEWDDRSQGALVLADGRFNLAGLRLHRGDNRIRVIGTDRAGNEAAAAVVARWEPLRTLAVLDAAPHVEGQLVGLEVALDSVGEVMGLSYVLAYDPGLFRDPEFTWAGGLPGGIRQVNYDTPGEVRATLAASQAIPAGQQSVGQLSLRARSVPAPTPGVVTPRVVDMSDAQGNQFPYGMDGVPGTVDILLRQAVGDNNGNRRLDIGDATVIQRFLVLLEPMNPWDVTGNDLNQSGRLDSGDVVKVLRAVVGLDPQPPVGGGGGVGLAGGGDRAGDDGKVVLAANRWHAAAGETVTVQVHLDGLTQEITGVAFALEYPPAALRLVSAASLQKGPMVPARALVLWNVVGGYAAQEGRVHGAFSSAEVWPTTNGVLAGLTFEVQPGVAQTAWPLRVSAVEVTGEQGYELRSVAAGELVLNPLPEFRAVTMTDDGLSLTVRGAVGLDYTLEASTGFQPWKAIGTRRNTDGVMVFLDPEALTVSARFYRVREGQ